MKVCLILLLAVAPLVRGMEILDASGIKGGLVVHLGCGDGKLTAALRANDSFLVHGLDADVAAARKHIQSLGLYGPVSVNRWSGGALPYIDNLVNLVVAEKLSGVSMDEVMRVLAPNGVAYIGGKKTVKPWPKEMDEWTHHLHNAGGNAVAHDTIVGPPQHLQWTDGPLWARSHGWTPSVSAMVSARGRLFYICDETLTGVDGTVPDKWFLSARDAFSGVLLWKQPVPHWGSDAFSGTPGTGRPVTAGRFTMPPNLGKRLVAVGDTVYVTLGANAPVTALDAATGATRRVYNETANADEILCVDGKLVVSLNSEQGKQVCAVDAVTGRMLWKKGLFTAVRATRAQDPFGRLELAAGGGQVFLLTEKTIESLNLNSGETAWRLDRPALPANAVLDIYPGFGVYEYRLTVMVYHDGVVLLAQPEPNVAHSYHTMPGTLYAFDGKTGRQMWKHRYGAWGHDTQPDVFVVNGLVWTHVHTETEMKGKAVLDVAGKEYRIQALDLRTGEVRKELPTKDIFNVGHHHRCYRNKITERFLTSSRRGVEFVDLATGENWQNHWVRSGCLIGNLPCNGLLYVAPHACGCYMDAKLTGFNALAPERKQKAESKKLKDERLERGVTVAERRASSADDWPTYRHDGQRSGATESRVGSVLGVRWTTPVGQRLSALTVADGAVCVADVDGHTIHALRASDGKPLWQFTADGRVDSPPTLHGGLAIFGSSAGDVYALRATDGALAWRFRAAPEDRRLFAHGQLESVWPVPGSVLVKDGHCWFAAGRSSYLDGGIRLYAIEPATGKIVRQETIYHPDPATGKMKLATEAQQMTGLLNDIPSTDGSSVFIRQMNLSGGDARDGRRVFSTAGYLDPSWFNRTFWECGAAETSGLMVLGKDAVFGMELYKSRSRETVFTPGAGDYRLVCRSLKRTGKQVKPVWEQPAGIRATAMVRAGDTIFVAGAPDAGDTTKPSGALAAFAIADGKKLREMKLPAPPMWDGMAAAGGDLYLATQDGKLVCLGTVK